MTILEICEPLFQHICRLSRMGRATSGSEFPVVRSQIKSLFDEIREKAAKEVALTAQYQRLELPLIFFVDSMIVESKLKFSSEWHKQRMAYERNELAGDDKFFDLLEETLHDSSPEASEALSVYYVCLGLGFTGCYMGQPEQLRKYQNQIFPRIRHLMDANETERICKEAYEKVDTRDLRQPPGVKMAWIGLLFVGLVLSFMIFYYWTFRGATERLRKAKQEIMKVDVRR